MDESEASSAAGSSSFSLRALSHPSSPPPQWPEGRPGVPLQPLLLSSSGQLDVEGAAAGHSGRGEAASLHSAEQAASSSPIARPSDLQPVWEGGSVLVGNRHRTGSSSLGRSGDYPALRDSTTTTPSGREVRPPLLSYRILCKKFASGSVSLSFSNSINEACRVGAPRQLRGCNRHLTKCGFASSRSVRNDAL